MHLPPKSLRLSICLPCLVGASLLLPVFRAGLASLVSQTEFARASVSGVYAALSSQVSAHLRLDYLSWEGGEMAPRSGPLAVVLLVVTLLTFVATAVLWWTIRRPSRIERSPETLAPGATTRTETDIFVELVDVRGSRGSTTERG